MRNLPTLRKRIASRRFEECLDAMINHMFIHGMHNEYSINEMKKELIRRFNG